MSEDLLPVVREPAPRPCASCPYRRDVPAGVWHREEYARLPGYDQVTAQQPPGMFLCHQSGKSDPRARVCAGWAHVHNRNPRGHELLALRLAAAGAVLTERALAAVYAYRTDVPCFDSGAQAARWGTDGPYTEASQAMAAAIIRRRPQGIRRR